MDCTKSIQCVDGFYDGSCLELLSLLAPCSLHQPPPHRGHTVREFYLAMGVYCPACGVLVIFGVGLDGGRGSVVQ